MKRARITYLIALPAAVLVLAGAAYATASANAGTGRSAADQVRTAERTLLRAAVDADTHTAGKLLAPGLQLIDVIGTAETRADYLATIGGGVDFVTLQPIDTISVRVHGDSAVSRVKLKFKVVAQGQTVQHEGWTTGLFELRDGRWQLVWSQNTAVPNNLGLFIQSLQPCRSHARQQHPGRRHGQSSRGLRSSDCTQRGADRRDDHPAERDRDE
jgi:Domain of unknown function (DUF4440)